MERISQNSPASALDMPGVSRVRDALSGLGAKKAHLVGGITRDAALGKIRLRPDIDLALPQTSLALARALAKALGGSAFALDEGEGAYRVAWEGGEIDLVRWRAPTLEGDLRGRDFTLNSIAVDLFSGEIFDPLEGQKALLAGILIPSSPESMGQDPLRALRALRFASQLGFSLSEETRRQMKEVAPKLKPDAGAVSMERIRDELFKTLGGDNFGAALRLGFGEGLLFAVFPFMEEWRGLDQGDYHEFDLLEHSLRAAIHAGEVSAALSAEIPWLLEHLEEEHEQNISRGALLRFAALFHDIAKPATRRVEAGGRVRFITHDTLGGKVIQKMLSGLKVGRKASRAAGNLVAGHMRLYGLAAQKVPTARSRVKYIRDLGCETPEAVILSLADETATGKGAAALEGLRDCGIGILERWRKMREAGDEPGPLLMGRDLVEVFGLPEGPAIGAVLKKIAKAESEGEISSRKEALGLAAKILGKKQGAFR